MKRSVSLSRRLFAALLDWTAITLIRLMILCLSIIWMHDSKEKFLIDFRLNFRAEYPLFDNKEHLLFFLHSDFATNIIALIVLFVLIGIIYHGITLSIYNASLGQKFMMLNVVTIDGNKPTTWACWLRSILSYIPWICLPLTIYFWGSARWLSIILILMISFWHDMSIFIKKGVMIHDVLSSTRLIQM